MKNLSQILIAIYLFTLVITGGITYYINPVYVPLVITMSLVILIVNVISIYLNRPELLRNIDFTESIVMVLLLLVMILFPVSTLSSSLAEDRGVNLGVNLNSSLELSPLLDRDTNSYNLIDWARLKASEPDISRLNGKSVNVRGFAFKNESTQYAIENYFLGKFIITCCAVDATPVGLEFNPNSIEVIPGEWYQINGKTKIESKDGLDYLVIIPEEIINIEEPSNPYAN